MAVITVVLVLSHMVHDGYNGHIDHNSSTCNYDYDS